MKQNRRCAGLNQGRYRADSLRLSRMEARIRELSADCADMTDAAQYLNANIGLMRVYHHIYNFGDTSMFISMGTPQRGYSVDAGGNVVRKCTLPVGVTVDERVCGGAVYAKLFAVMKNCLRHPEQLETPPEKVFYNKGCEFHVPKPENVFHPAGAAEGSVTA